MTSPLGVGDCITIATLALQAWKTVSDAPDKVGEAASDVRAIKASLSILRRTVGDEYEFINTGGTQVATVLKENMKDLKTQLSIVRKLIAKWASFEKLGRIEAKSKKLYYSFVSMRDLDDACQKIDKHSKRIDMTLQSLQLANTQDILAALERQRKGDAKETRKRAAETKKLAAAIKKVDQSMKDIGIGTISQEACNPKTTLWNKLETELVQQGVSEAKTEAAINTIKDSVMKINASPLIYSLPNRKPDQLRILCVDGSNMVRPVLMQAYLELIRVWTANTSHQWLFKEVSSARYLIESPLTLKHQKHIKKPLIPPETLSDNKALLTLSQQDHFGSAEKVRIFKRLGSYQVVELQASHFNQWDYILCFEESTFTQITTLRACTDKAVEGKPQQSRIVHLQGVEIHNDIGKTITQVKHATRDWLSQEFLWVRPIPPVKGGPWRTLQITITDQCYKALTAKADKISKEIQAESGCRIYVSTKYKSWRSVVSIVGSKESLSKAEKMINKLT